MPGPAGAGQAGGLAAPPGHAAGHDPRREHAATRAGCLGTGRVLGSDRGGDGGPASARGLPHRLSVREGHRTPDAQGKLAVRYAVQSDIGLHRQDNEDAVYGGPRLLAVADGMGGHTAGEVASAAVIEALRALDIEVPAGELLDALDHAVRRANSALNDMVKADPSRRGMGTTLTALLWSGSQLGLVHIGDSRAYLVRDGEMFQITQDHTLVQSLLDDGKITAEEVASHPQRHAAAGAERGDFEPDLQLREARPGDRYLLCSDGLHQVVAADTLVRVLLTVSDPDQAVADLIALAIDGGGPDNVSCIVADVVALEEEPAQVHQDPQQDVRPC